MDAGSLDYSSHAVLLATPGQVPGLQRRNSSPTPLAPSLVPPWAFQASKPVGWFRVLQQRDAVKATESPRPLHGGI